MVIQSVIKQSLKRVLYSLTHRSFPKETRILFYHSIDDTGSDISTSVETFQRQMAFLKQENYHTISLSDYIGKIHGNKEPSHQDVIITFDDGFKSTYLQAYQILIKFGCIATVFLTTDYVDGYANWILRDISLIENRLFNSSIKKK